MSEAYNPRHDATRIRTYVKDINTMVQKLRQEGWTVSVQFDGNAQLHITEISRKESI